MIPRRSTSTSPRCHSSQTSVAYVPLLGFYLRGRCDDSEVACHLATDDVLLNLKIDAVKMGLLRCPGNTAAIRREHLVLVEHGPTASFGTSYTACSPSKVLVVTSTMTSTGQELLYTTAAASSTTAGPDCQFGPHHTPHLEWVLMLENALLRAPSVACTSKRTLAFGHVGSMTCQEMSKLIVTASAFTLTFGLEIGVDLQCSFEDHHGLTAMGMLHVDGARHPIADLPPSHPERSPFLRLRLDSRPRFGRAGISRVIKHLSRVWAPDKSLGTLRTGSIILSAELSPKPGEHAFGLDLTAPPLRVRGMGRLRCRHLLRHPPSPPPPLS